MLFNSLHFLIFLPVVVLGYFLLPHRFRWVWLLAASYYFYMCWEVKYALLILFSTALSYVTGHFMGNSHNQRIRRIALIISLVGNLSVLFVFKYYGFFSGACGALLAEFGLSYNTPVLKLLLPVGISFYTFQALSYSIDVYRGDRPPEKHAGIFALYVSFFPQLVAGPIERSTHLMPQFFERHDIDSVRITSGIKLIAWGFFKKLVIADRLAVVVNRVYDNPFEFHGMVLAVATVFFAYQIYCDFSAYSDIAIGSARILGFDLMTNFRCPYHAVSIGDFWKRWHISLTSWFMDYLYIPLGGSRINHRRWILNVLAVFVISGLWHGANWTFLAWGGLHGVYFLVSKLTASFRMRFASIIGLHHIPRGHAFFRIIITFTLVCAGWVFFRADSILDAWYILTTLTQGIVQFMWNVSDVAYVRSILGQLGLRRDELMIAVGAIVLLEGVQIVLSSDRIIAGFYRRPTWVRWAFYYLIAGVILFYGSFNAGQDFIYFQF